MSTPCSSYAGSINNTDIPILCLNDVSDPSQRGDTPLDISVETSGLVALRREHFEGLLSKQQALMKTVAEQSDTIRSLRRQVDAGKATQSRDNTSSDITDLYRKLLDSVQRERELSNSLVAAQKELAEYKVENKSMKADLESYDYDYKSLSNDYTAVEILNKRFKELFSKKMSEVFLAQAELREPRLRPKASEGCLNCGQQGHSFRLCKQPYTGKYCQKCAIEGFSTADCPWPHYAMVRYQVPESNRCKHCWRPRNFPDVNCYECRRRLISSNTFARNKTAQELESRPVPKAHNNPQPSSSQGAIKKQKALPAPSKGPLSLETAVVKLPDKLDAVTVSETLKAEVHTKETSEESPRSALSPFDSDNDNAEYWETLTEVIHLGIKKEKKNDL
ncbi:uncharacterized protein LOC127291227 [Leptopilina boulardi]|uniref:uncharacterized protein LOC127291227 n=1 Tax=Leptopilina boulardi TaxID=63433 RepID=UPI0021F5D1C1|nr:uncharacterized protein LOC127291227 [Leptopilina boulardi]